MNCPGCGRVLEDDAAPAGQQVICSACATVFVMPGDAGGFIPSNGADLQTSAGTVESLPPEAPPVVCEPEPPPLSAPSQREDANPHPDGVEETADLGPSFSRRLARVLGAVVVVLLVLILGILGTRQARQMLHSPRLGAEPALAQLIVQLHDPEPDVRRKAARAIADRGPAALEAALDDITNVPDEAEYAIVEAAVPALAAVGRDLAEPLGELLRSRQVDVRVGAARVLREMEKNSLPALHRLREALGDRHRWVRAFAADALGGLGAAGAPAVPDLMALLDHADRHTRLRAARALGEIGPKARQASEALRRRWENDGDRAVRDAAMVACHQVDLESLAEQSAAKASEAVQALITRLQDPDPLERATAARALGSRGFDAADAVPWLAKLLDDRDPWVREAAAKALGSLGADARPVLSALRRALKDPQAEVRDAAEKSLAAVESPPNP